MRGWDRREEVGGLPGSGKKAELWTEEGQEAGGGGVMGGVTVVSGCQHPVSLCRAAGGCVWDHRHRRLGSSFPGNLGCKAFLRLCAVFSCALCLAFVSCQGHCHRCCCAVYASGQRQSVAPRAGIPAGRASVGPITVVLVGAGLCSCFFAQRGC